MTATMAAASVPMIPSTGNDEDVAQTVNLTVEGRKAGFDGREPGGDVLVHIA